jgi:N-glycosylase/DNA lyase
VLDESTLRECRMGFRAPFLLAAARAVDAGRIDLAKLGTLEEEEARERLITLRGVGRKIADCVLLFACGFPRAFPVDVWVSRALRELYFGGRDVTERELLQFSRSHFGPRGGYAQQYLFHYMRVHRGGRSSETKHRSRARSLVSS